MEPGDESSLPLDEVRVLAKEMYEKLRGINPGIGDELEAVLGRPVGDALRSDQLVIDLFLLLLEVLKEYTEYLAIMKKTHELMTKLPLGETEKPLREEAKPGKINRVIIALDSAEIDISSIVTKHHKKIARALELYREIFLEKPGRQLIETLAKKSSMPERFKQTLLGGTRK